LALIVPWKLVNASDHTTTLPPAPVVPLALISAPCAIVVVCAVWTGAGTSFIAGSSPPRRSPPIRIVPPLVPLASSLAPGVSVRLRPVAMIVPPGARLAPETESFPEIVTSPPAPPSSTMLPLRPETERADNDPETLTASRTACCAVAALISMRPPAARTRPATSTSAPPLAAVAAVGNATCRKPSPVGSRVACSPEPRPTLPSGTLIEPALATVPPMRPTKPPRAAEIVPALLTAAEAPLPVQVRRPALKSALAMSRVEATKPPPTWTVPLGVIAMPLGLTRKTWPLPVICPAMVDGADPVTRLRMAADASGWTKTTLSGWPTEKLPQLTIARDDDCVTVSALALGTPMPT